METPKTNSAEINKGESYPWFSIVVSVYNRDNVINRCIESCLKQSFVDFEVVVVDDGSSDGIKDILDSIDDRRLKAIYHAKNSGLCVARDTGARNATGRWIITLDSDHALLPGALDNLYNRTKEATADVGIIGSRYSWDTGKITPSFVPEGVIDYIGRLKWVDQEGGTDYLCCYRRELYGRVCWPVNSRKGDHIFQLDLAKQSKAKIDADVIAVQYSDEDNSESRFKGLKGMKNLIRYAPDWAWQAEEVLRRHGHIMEQNAAGAFRLTLRTAALCHFIIGQRKAGLHRIIRYLLMSPFSAKGWAILCLGLLHGQLLAFVHVFRKDVTRNLKPKHFGMS